MEISDEGPWGSLSENRITNKVHCKSNAPWAVNWGQVQAATVIASEAVVFWGCAGMNLTAKLPSYGMIKVYAVSERDPHGPATR